ncbi:MAG: hypothetical protein ACYS99_06285, partial [Planctomycetota bacterium]
MRAHHALLALCTLVLLAGLASGEQIRLENGRVIEGEILSEETTEESLAVKLYATGGVVRLPWA